MLSADDAEYPREYRTLGGGGGGGGGGRRFSNVGLVHTSERRHTVIAAQSLEALSGLQKADADRKRDAFMDHLKSKYPQHALALRGQQERMREQVSGVGLRRDCGADPRLPQQPSEAEGRTGGGPPAGQWPKLVFFWSLEWKQAGWAGPPYLLGARGGAEENPGDREGRAAPRTGSPNTSSGCFWVGLGHMASPGCDMNPKRKQGLGVAVD